MGRFSLLDDPWIIVMVDQKGATEEVSLKTLFEHAHEYRALAGETKTQDFAVLRVLLAVMHTVFSRFNANGEDYGYVSLDAKMKPLESLEDEDEIKEYKKELLKTWTDLWKMGAFPAIVNDYLEVWRERFYLLDENYPFFQVTSKDIQPQKLSKAKPSSISGKNINRLISESGNKIALFSPKYQADNNKEILTASEVLRWLITFQAYVGLSDKVIFGIEKYKASKGWLFDLGGIVLEGSNLYEMLLLNCVLVHPEEKYLGHMQRPCWEYGSSEVIERHFSPAGPDNLAELYTNWSRGIYIDPNIDFSQPFTFDAVKVPEINHKDLFLELMTLWRYNATGENKDTFTPKKHQVNQALWRSFGLLTLSYEHMGSNSEKKSQVKPGIMEWLKQVTKSVGDLGLSIQAISMQDDGNATSWVPTDEIIDSLTIDDAVVTDLQENGWVLRIHDVVEESKKIIGFTYKNFLLELQEIRNLSSNQWVTQEVEELYFLIDQPFRIWLAGIRPHDSKEEKVFMWRSILKRLVQKQAERLVKQAGPRDYHGIVIDEKMKNIATAYNRFDYFLKKELVMKEG